MRILIYVVVFCFIFINLLQITSAFDLLNMFRQAIGISNQSEKHQQQYQRQLLMPQKRYPYQRHGKSIHDNFYHCCS
jgi:hypothetical protein